MNILEFVNVFIVLEILVVVDGFVNVKEVEFFNVES